MTIRINKIKFKLPLFIISNKLVVHILNNILNTNFSSKDINILIKTLKKELKEYKHMTILKVEINNDMLIECKL